MRIVVIGATGHIGSYLVPRLLAGGHEVVAVSRGVREPYLDAPEWARVEWIVLDRQAEEARGTFGSSIAEQRPHVVTVSAEDARLTEGHLAHSPCASIAKACRLLGYQPRYSSLEALRESLSGLIRSGKITGPALDPTG
ncbi:MAG: NAD-dependent epimerase/dehydratase family protein [Gemmatimonadetes bacterium]|jgi:nucleoside-diphosphate-sugar epimerase|nr:NAD-dependent epimerase/dehydratase family protein [Gemmatimonadota bacterium]